MSDDHENENSGTALDGTSTVGEWVTQRLSRSRIFEQFDIDYCCGGQMSLGEACRVKGVELDEVLGALRNEAGRPVAAEFDVDLAALTPTALCDHIETVHHRYLRSEMPRLAELVAKVNRVHGERHPELAELERVFAALRHELDSHLEKEEKILFPMIRELETASSLPGFHCGSIGNPIRVMEHEHDSAGEALAHIRRCTDDFTTPEDACTSYRAMLEGLLRFEFDMHQHIHKENNVLFPRGLALERALD